jgi:hypothetical protein
VARAGGPDRGTGDEKTRATAESITTLKERLDQMQAELDRLARRSEKEWRAHPLTSDGTRRSVLTGS